MEMTIIGGGNIGTGLAAYFKLSGHNVRILTSKPTRWSGHIEVLQDGISRVTAVDLITSDPMEAISGAEAVWITVPPECFNEWANKLLHYVHPGQILIAVPGSGGAEYAFARLMQKGVKFAGLQRVPFIARLLEYGRRVELLSWKHSITIAHFMERWDCKYFLSSVFPDLFVVEAPNYLSITLSPSNPILHTARLYAIFGGCLPYVKLENVPLFYEEWTNESSEILLAMDCELQSLCSAIPADLSFVKPILQHYESADAPSLTQKIRSIDAFKGMLTPAKKVDGHYLPDFSSRYFTSDFAFGLKILIDFCDIFNVKCPMMITVWNWYLGSTSTLDRGYFSINLEKDTLLKFYGIDF